MLENNSQERGRRADSLVHDVYRELRSLATQQLRRLQPGQSLDGTALVHDAYLRLRKEGSGPRWANEAHFFSAAAEAMRRVLIDRIRSKTRVKRGGGRSRIHLDSPEVANTLADADDLLQINEAIQELAEVDNDSADLVKMRFFAGLTVDQIAEIRGVSSRTIDRHWAYARAWLLSYLDSD